MSNSIVNVHSMRSSVTLIKGLLDMIDMIPQDYRNLMVEIGSYQGESTMMFAASFEQVHAVDPWATSDPSRYKIPQISDAEAIFNQRLRFIGNITKVMDTSPEAAGRFEDLSLDFVYIDGHHGFRQVISDIEAWTPKVRPGGFLGGHDYEMEGHPDVKKAVDSVFDGYKQVHTFCDSSWLVRL